MRLLFPIREQSLCLHHECKEYIPHHEADTALCLCAEGGVTSQVC